MKVILDECLPKGLVNHISGYDVTTVPLAGYAGYKNGELLAVVEDGFDVFVTIDSNLQWQQKLENLKVIVILLRAYSNRLDDLICLVPQIIDIISNGRGTVRVISSL